MPEKFSECIICGDNKILEDTWAAKRLGLIHPYNVMKCALCDIRWLSPRPTDEEYKEMYRKDNYFTGDQVPENYEVMVKDRVYYYEKRCKKIQEIIGKDSFKLLDIGGGTGEFVNLARGTGIEAEGIEISAWACKMAKKKYNIDLKCKDLFNANFSNSSFDVVHMHHVFEHISRPLEFLQKVKKILRENGLLVLEVPYQFYNALERIKQVLGRTKFQRYSLFSIHHPFFYSPRSLRTVLETYGFDILTKNTFDRDNPYSETNSNFPLGGLIKTVILTYAGIFDQGNFIEIYARSK